MSSNKVENPYPIFTDTNGRQLENGYIYIGQPGLDAEFNQVSIYSDPELTIPVSQPVRTSGGYPVVNGAVFRFYVDGNHSIKVKNKNGELVYSANNSNSLSGSASTNFATLADAKAATYLIDGCTVKTDGYYSQGDGGSNEFYYDSSSSATVNDGSIVALNTLTGRLIQKDTTHIHLKQFGAKGDGITDDTSAFEAAVGFMQEGHTLVVKNGTFKITEVVFDVVKGTLTGGGTIDGTILFRHPNYNQGINELNLFFTCDNIKFISSTATDGIRLESVRRGNITNCHFEGLTYGIRVPVNVHNTFGQHTNRIRITNNTYKDVDYFIRGFSTVGIVYSTADYIITGNEGTARVTTIELDSADGCTISNNIMFFPGYTEQSQDKSYHVNIANGVWLNIHDNKFFESGKEGLVLSGCTRFSVHDNLYAFGGQNEETFAIVVANTPAAGNYFTQGEIHSEVVVDQSGGGIWIKGSQGRVQLHNNDFQTVGNNNATITRYYGSDGAGNPALTNQRRAILIDANTLDIKVNDNHGRWCDIVESDGIGASNTFTNNIMDVQGDGGKVIRDTRLRTAQPTGSTQNISDVEKINFNHSSPTNFTSFVNNGQSKLITCRFFNNNTTLVHDGINIALAGGVNFTPDTRDMVTFLVEGTLALEVSRSQNG